MIIVMLMVMAVDALLLYASGRFLGAKESLLRVLVASLAGALFTLLSLMPDFFFLDHILWRLCSYLLIGLTAFGFLKSAIPKIFLFSLLHLSLGGVTGSKNEMISMLLGAAGIGFACLLVGLRREFVPVELTSGGRTLHLTALRDTGHSLRDPISGKAVLVVDADTAKKLTGLAPEALCDPVNNLGTFPGLRLIPYKTVGNTGFLLAVQIPEARIGNRRESILVALSPQLLGKHYQALTGGNL